MYARAHAHRTHSTPETDSSIRFFLQILWMFFISFSSTVLLLLPLLYRLFYRFRCVNNNIKVGNVRAVESFCFATSKNKTVSTVVFPSVISACFIHRPTDKKRNSNRFDPVQSDTTLDTLYLYTNEKLLALAWQMELNGME